MAQRLAGMPVNVYINLGAPMLWWIDYLEGSDRSLEPSERPATGGNAGMR